MRVSEVVRESENERERVGEREIVWGEREKNRGTCVGERESECVSNTFTPLTYKSCYNDEVEKNYEKMKIKLIQ